MAGLSDSRGVSETAGVAVLIAVTVLVVLSVGASVLIDTGEEDTGVEFQFVYSDQLSQLTIIYQDDKELPAGEIYVDGPAGNYTWAEYSDIDPSESIGSADTIFIRNRQPYDSDVGESDYFEIVHTPPDGEAEVIASWNEENAGQDGEDGEDDPFGGDSPEPGN
jgi:hypothetical protein